MLILSYQIGLSMLSGKVLQMSNVAGENVWKFQAFLLVSRIMNWRPKYSAFWKKLTPL